MEDGKPTVAVLGAAWLGAPVAERLIAAGFLIQVWQERNPSPRGAVRPLVAGSPAEAATGADVVLTLLGDGAAVDKAMTAPEGALFALRPGSVWIQMSTIALKWTQRLARVAAARSISFIDAPLSGDVPAAGGESIVLASGPDELRERVQPLFDAIAGRTAWLGLAGDGTRLKLALEEWHLRNGDGVLASAVTLTPGRRLGEAA